MTVTGMSPVSPVLPQPLARAEVSAGGETVRIGSDDLTWETLTAAVERARDGIADRADAAERELVAAGKAMRRASAEVERATIRQRAAITEAAAGRARSPVG